MKLKNYIIHYTIGIVFLVITTISFAARIKNGNFSISNIDKNYSSHVVILPISIGSLKTPGAEYCKQTYPDSPTCVPVANLRPDKKPILVTFEYHNIWEVKFGHVLLLIMGVKVPSWRFTVADGMSYTAMNKVGDYCLTKAQCLPWS